MKLRQIYFNLSIRNKILLFFCSIIVVIVLILGLFSYSISKNNVMQKVSMANLTIIKQVENNINVLKNDITDISTYLCIDRTVQYYLTDNLNFSSDILVARDSSMEFIMNLVVSKSYISMISIYGDTGLKPYSIVTDASSGLNEDFSVIKQTEIYHKAVELKGSPLWFSMDSDHILLTNNNYPKIAMCRIIKDNNTAKGIGLLVVCMNKKNIEDICTKNVQNGKEGMIIVDSEGSIVTKVGIDFYNSKNKNQAFIRASLNQKEGSLVDKIDGKSYLISYSSFNNSDWKTYYAVPMESLTKQINSIRIFTVVMILACLLLSFPLMLVISFFLTAPITKLLKSMKSFQLGNFDERVEFKYNDEIGELGYVYNNMVRNIKELIDKVYVLQIKEQEAELNALQAQINPHFLYNTLDTIFWKSQAQGEKEIGEMVFSLSRLFRLSLNRGKGLTLVENEKELIEHYLMLQKIRFKEKLDYTILMDDNILRYVMPKLILQPFVENAILHGIESKENGGTIQIKGALAGDTVQFIIEDDGNGMSKEVIDSILSQNDEDNVNTSIVKGGYAVKNVNDRLKLNYGDKYSLKFTSNVGMGTRVEIVIPVIQNSESLEV